MKKYFLLLITIAIAPIFQTEAIQILPSRDANRERREEIARYNQYNMQQEQLELLRRQVQTQEKMVRMQRCY